jgi:tungstate transport system substrate-binding protein
MKHRIISLLILLTLLLSACQPATVAPTAVEPTTAPAVEPTAAAPAVTEMILSTTTSTQDSGLLDVLVPAFEKKYGYTVKVVAVGSGAALKMGEEGNADVLFVHSPTAEVTFMENGFGEERFLAMHNDFVLVGPTADPAGIKGLTTVEALKKIATEEAIFIARGDESGTSTKELGFWKKAELDPKGTKPAWYIETGQGMGATLTIASEKSGYTLTDRATFLANKANLSLEILLEGENALLNIYHVITVSPAKWPKVNNAGAKAFAEFVLSAEGKAIISVFGVEKYGQPLFFWDGDKTDADLGLK